MFNVCASSKGPRLCDLQAISVNGHVNLLRKDDGRATPIEVSQAHVCI